jgi:hypothetical protein
LTGFYSEQAPSRQACASIHEERHVPGGESGQHASPTKANLLIDLVAQSKAFGWRPECRLDDDSVEKLKTLFFQGMSKPARRRDRRIQSDCERRSFWPNLPFRQKASFSTASDENKHSNMRTWRRSMMRRLVEA